MAGTASVDQEPSWWVLGSGSDLTELRQGAERRQDLKSDDRPDDGDDHANAGQDE